MSEGADRCGPKRWVPICGVRSVVAEAVGADSKRANPWGPRRWGPTQAGSICGIETIAAWKQKEMQWHGIRHSIKRLMDRAIIIRSQSNQKTNTPARR